MVKTVILPLLSVGQTSILAITTFGRSPKNYASELLRKGTFPSLVLSLICPCCFSKGARDVCRHRIHLLPFWIRQEKRELIKDAMGVENQDDYAREMTGMLVDETQNCFPQHMVDQLFDGPRIRVKAPVNFLFVTIDPSGGSDKITSSVSDFAVCCHVEPGFNIIGLDAYPIQNASDINTRLKTLLDKIVYLPFFLNSKIVLSVEGNTGPTAGYISDYLKTIYTGRVIPLSTFNRGEKIGMLQTNKTKNEMYTLMRHALFLSRVSLSDTIFTTESSESTILNKLRAQLLSYKIEITASNNTRFTGKGLYNKDKDDLCVTVQMAIYCAKYFFSSERYTKYL